MTAAISYFRELNGRMLPSRKAQDPKVLQRRQWSPEEDWWRWTTSAWWILPPGTCRGHCWLFRSLGLHCQSFWPEADHISFYYHAKAPLMLLDVKFAWCRQAVEREQSKQDDNTMQVPAERVRTTPAQHLHPTPPSQWDARIHLGDIICWTSSRCNCIGDWIMPIPGVPYTSSHRHNVIQKPTARCRRTSPSVYADVICQCLSDWGERSKRMIWCRKEWLESKKKMPFHSWAALQWSMSQDHCRTGSSLSWSFLSVRLDIHCTKPNLKRPSRLFCAVLTKYKFWSMSETLKLERSCIKAL